MNTSNEIVQSKESWYSTLKQNPEALAKFKENKKEQYEIRKQFIKELASVGVIAAKPKPVPYKKVDPEVKRRYNEKYYNANREQITNQKKEYVQKERTKEESSLMNYIREYQRTHYHEKVKHSPELMEQKRRIAREYSKKKREQLKLAKSQSQDEHCDSETSASSSL